MSDQPTHGKGVILSRDKDLSVVTLIGISVMVGAGVFVLMGIAVGQAGPAVLVALVLNGLVTAISAASYAELGSCLPEASGGYLWVKQALGSLAGFLAGWVSWLAHASAGSLLALGCGAYLAELLARLRWIDASPQDWARPIAVGIVAALVYRNIRGARHTGRLSRLVTLAVIAVIGLFVAAGLSALGSGPAWAATFDPFSPSGADGVLAAMGLTFVAFAGYEVIAQSGEGLKNPGRNFPRAVFGSFAASSAIVLLTTFVVLALSGRLPGSSGMLAVVEAGRHLPPGWSELIAVGGVLITAVALNATIYSSSRLAFTMGRDGLLPNTLGAIHPRWRTPHWSIAASAALIVVMTMFLPIEAAAAVAGVAFTLTFALVNLCAMALRRAQPQPPPYRIKAGGAAVPRRFHMPLMPALPILGIGLMLALALAALTAVSGVPWLIGVWLLAGAMLYTLYSRLREVEPRAPVLEAHLEFTRDFRVVLPIAKQERVEQLAPLAAALAGAAEGEVLAVHVEVVPPQLPLRTGRHFVDEHVRSAMKRAEQILTEADVPVSSMVRIGHDAVSGLAEAAREIDADVIVMGWRPKPRTRNRLLGPTLGPTLDPMLANPPCNILVLRAESIDTPRRILVPLAGGPNATLALAYALRLAERWDGQVSAITVVPERANEAERASAEKMLREAAGKHASHPRLRFVLVPAAGPVEAILAEAASHDLVMLGASREGVVDRVLFGDIPERIASQSSAPVIIVKRRLSQVTGWLRRALDGVTAHMPRLSPEDVIEVYKSIRRAARPDADYFVMIGLASGIASLGLLLNSPAVIIGAMLVAPLMAAIVGLGMGVVMGDLRLLKLAASATARGMFLAIGVGVLAGLLAFDSTPTVEVLSRARPSLLDLGVALVSGAAGAYALCREDVSNSLPGVAIAAALVPPLATVGIGLSDGNLAVAGGALLLFVTNLVAISAASVIVFLAFGFRPDPEAERLSILRRGAIGAVVLLTIVAVTLGALTINLVNQVRFDQEVRAAIAAEVAALDQAELVEFKIDPLAQDGVHLQVTIRSPRAVSYGQTVALQQGIAGRLNRTVALLLTVIPTTQLDPFVPPTPTPTPTPGPTTTPTATYTPTPTTTSTPTPTDTPTATPTHTATSTPTPVVVGVIANTNGRGVLLRASPGGSTFTALREGARVTLILIEPVSANGRDWLRVRDESGIEGWVAAEYVLITP